jgi:hypothetical protein
MDHASHTIFAMRGTEVRIIATAVKSVLIDRSAIGKNSRVAVRIIRRAKLSIARSAAGDTMAATDPSPSHCVARVDADFVWHKREALPDHHIENLAASRCHAIRHWLSVLIENPNAFGSALFLCRDSGASVSRISLRQKLYRKHHGHNPSRPRSKLPCNDRRKAGPTADAGNYAAEYKCSAATSSPPPS